jgi:subtilisin family serine protease
MHLNSIFTILLTVSTSVSLLASDYEVTTVLKEKFYDKNGNLLTGKGVVIGDVDSGIDIFHPMFFFADGGEFNWVDSDGDGKLTLGVDGVDLNNDGRIDKSEVLRYLEIKDNTWNMLEGSEPKKYNPEYDFLYIDKNSNKKRDYGAGAGFTENDPTYGEQFFITIDENKNGKLDTYEKIIALKTSKVRAVREKSGTVRRRGIDLIYTEEDSTGHGTGVAGMILGGHYGIQKVHGIAPDAEIIVASVKYDYTPRFVRNFPGLVSFLREEKVNILLFEDGEWMWEFLDGSSEEEELVNEMARDGITIVGGSGNFAGGNMMIIDTNTANQTSTYKIDCPQFTEGNLNDGVFISFLWRDADLTFSIVTPEGQTSPELMGSSDFIKAGRYNIFYAKDTSPRGTVMFKLAFSKSDSGSIEGVWKIHVKNTEPVVIRGYIVDISQSWEGTSHWVSPLVTDASSVVFPSTADSCIAVGAYVVNFGWFDKIGDLAYYSSRGYNITGKPGVDITAPGHTTFTTVKNFGWQVFSGTSSAAPHVVGAAALMLQYEPSLTHTQIRQIILNTAASDNFTGPVPNPDWGYGKLNIETAVKYLINNY